MLHAPLDMMIIRDMKNQGNIFPWSIEGYLKGTIRWYRGGDTGTNNTVMGHPIAVHKKLKGCRHFWNFKGIIISTTGKFYPYRVGSDIFPSEGFTVYRKAVPVTRGVNIMGGPEGIAPVGILEFPREKGPLTLKIDIGLFEKPLAGNIDVSPFYLLAAE